MKTQRDVFWDTIYELAKKDRDVIIISADMGAPALDRIRTDLPAQFINTGIAEQNAILIASGLAKEGKKVFVYAIASFLTLNCIEKIRVQNSMMNIPINLVGVGAGFSYPDSGPTHHLIEDISIMRSMPNIQTYSVSDPMVAKKLAESYKSFNTTTYIRLERENFSPLHESSDAVNLERGMDEIINGTKTLVISNGAAFHKTAKLIEDNNLTHGLVDLYKFPINEKELINIVAKYDSVITVEEHFLPGGIGSAVLEVLSDNNISKTVKRIGLTHDKGYCYKYGGREEVHKHYNFSNEEILNQLL